MACTFRGLRSFLLMIACLLAVGCRTTRVLTEAALVGCGTSTIYLGGWWASRPAGSTIDMDPMGGFLLAYWIDEAGNACHGTPGQTGQLGPAAVKASLAQARSLATGRSPVPESQLKSLQEIPTSFASYAGSGLHFVQFDNTIWRERASGNAFEARSDGVFAVPVVTDIGSRACVAPVAFRTWQGMFLPGFSPSTGQDPTHCLRRTRPTGAPMTDEELKRFDVLTLPHGTEVSDVP